VGGAVLAKQAECQIVPVTHNSGSFWLNDQFVKQSGVVDIYIHPPIDTQGRVAEDLMAETERVITNQLEAIESRTDALEELDGEATA
jgi:1-acyl-sn-glycerol-3-phosphate acyltransferase